MYYTKIAFGGFILGKSLYYIYQNEKYCCGYDKNITKHSLITGLFGGMMVYNNITDLARPINDINLLYNFVADLYNFNGIFRFGQ